MPTKEDNHSLTILLSPQMELEAPNFRNQRDIDKESIPDGSAEPESCFVTFFTFFFITTVSIISGHKSNSRKLSTEKSRPSGCFDFSESLTRSLVFESMSPGNIIPPDSRSQM